MIYRQFKQCKPGTHVADNERTGVVIKISQDKEKALVRFSDGMTEWVEYYKVEMIEKAEKAVIARASKIAYERSNNLDDSEVQAMLYRLCKDYIILGARMMEEELMKLGYYETEKDTHRKSKG